MANLTADKVVGKTMIAKRSVNAYRSIYDTAKPLRSFKAGSVIGRVFSWVQSMDDGSLWWMFQDPAAGGYYYVKHTAGALDLSEMRQILNEVKEEAEKKEREEKGLIQYNIDKYVPYLIGGLVLAWILPNIKLTSNGK